MSRSGEITLAWGDQDRTFRLGIKEWELVQEKCDAGPAEIHRRLAPMFAATEAGLSFPQIKANGYLGTWRVHDVREPIYRGLIGGGMEPTTAGKLVKELVDERELIENVCLAYRIVDASIVGAPDEPLGEPEEGETAATPSPTESSASANTTAPARPSGSRPATSGPAHSGSSSPPSKAGRPPTARSKGPGRRPPKSTTP